MQPVLGGSMAHIKLVALVSETFCEGLSYQTLQIAYCKNILEVFKWNITSNFKNIIYNSHQNNFEFMPYYYYFHPLESQGWILTFVKT